MTQMSADREIRERPILFADAMARAVFRGKKSQTRRLVKTELEYDGGAYWQDKNGDLRPIESACPYGAPGDRLWVRETWSRDGCQHKCGHLGCHTIYRADSIDAIGAYGCVKWKPSIHMPRWASRIDLEVTGVRVERLQGISEADAVEEGIREEGSGCICPPEKFEDGVRYCGACGLRIVDWVDEFAQLWDSINGARASWASNPWVWVVEFKRVMP